MTTLLTIFFVIGLFIALIYELIILSCYIEFSLKKIQDYFVTPLIGDDDGDEYCFGSILINPITMAISIIGLFSQACPFFLLTIVSSVFLFNIKYEFFKIASILINVAVLLFVIIMYVKSFV